MFQGFAEYDEGFHFGVSKKSENELQFHPMLAPMSGRIVSINVQENERVRKGQLMFVFETMKMLNQLRSTVDGVVNSICVETDSNLMRNSPLAIIEIQVD